MKKKFNFWNMKPWNNGLVLVLHSSYLFKNVSIACFAGHL